MRDEDAMRREARMYTSFQADHEKTYEKKVFRLTKKCNMHFSYTGISVPVHVNESRVRGGTYHEMKMVLTFETFHPTPGRVQPRRP